MLSFLWCLSVFRVLQIITFSLCLHLDSIQTFGEMGLYMNTFSGGTQPVLLYLIIAVVVVIILVLRNAEDDGTQSCHEVLL